MAASSGLVGHSGIYSLTVHASDWGTPSKTGSAKVIVRVIDFNDHKPVLSVYNNRTTSVNRPEVRELYFITGVRESVKIRINIKMIS